MKTRVLMVCLGNICRSPLAEGVLQKLVKDQGRSHEFEIDSAGTADYHVGHAPDRRSIKIAKQYGIELTHRGRQFTKNDFQNFDFILVMDHSNLKNVLELAQTEIDRAKVSLLASYDETRQYGDIVDDPYWGEMDDFERMYQHVLKCCNCFFNSQLKK